MPRTTRSDLRLVELVPTQWANNRVAWMACGVEPTELGGRHRYQYGPTPFTAIRRLILDHRRRVARRVAEALAP